jgi:hypothetical protein
MPQATDVFNMINSAESIKAVFAINNRLPANDQNLVTQGGGRERYSIDYIIYNPVERGNCCELASPHKPRAFT